MCFSIALYTIHTHIYTHIGIINVGKMFKIGKSELRAIENSQYYPYNLSINLQSFPNKLMGSFKKYICHLWVDVTLKHV